MENWNFKMDTDLEMLDFKKEVVKAAYSKIYQEIKRNVDLSEINKHLVTNNIHSYLTLLSLGGINERIGEGFGTYVSNFLNDLKPSIHNLEYLNRNRALSANDKLEQICFELEKIDPQYFPADVFFKDKTKNEALDFFKASVESFVNKTLKLNLVNSGKNINDYISTQNLIIGEVVTKAFLPSDMGLMYIKDLNVQKIRKFLDTNSDFDIVEYGNRKTFKRIFEKTKDDDLELEF